MSDLLTVFLVATDLWQSRSASLYFVVALTFWYGMYLLASGEYDVRAFYLVFLGMLDVLPLLLLCLLTLSLSYRPGLQSHYHYLFARNINC